MFKIVVLLICAIMLAACGGQPNPPPAVSNPNNTPTPESSEGVVDSLTSDTAFELEYIDFTLDVAGEVTQNLSGTMRVADANDHRLIALAPPDFAYQATLIVKRDTPVGEHALTQAGGPVGAQFAVGLGIEPDSTYMNNVSGTLTLTSVQPLEGSFEFTAANDSEKTVTVNGTFTEIPVVFRLTASGAVTGSVPPGEVFYSTTLNEPSLSINGNEPNMALMFVLPADAPAGEYTLMPYLSEGDGVEVIFSVNGQDYPEIEGTLNLTDGGVGLGERIAGTFTITAKSADGAETVNIEGSFSDVPYVG